MSACSIDRERESSPDRPAQTVSEAAAPSEISSSGPPKVPDARSSWHYVIVREDLPRGVLAAHVLHAAGESGPAPPGSIAVALGVPSEAELLRVAARLEDLRVAHVLIREDAGPFAGQATAIGLPPTADRGSIRRATSSLRLVK